MTMANHMEATGQSWFRPKLMKTMTMATCPLSLVITVFPYLRCDNVMFSGNVSGCQNPLGRRLSFLGSWNLFFSWNSMMMPGVQFSGYSFRITMHPPSILRFWNASPWKIQKISSFRKPNLIPMKFSIPPMHTWQKSLPFRGLHIGQVMEIPKSRNGVVERLK